MHRDPAIPKDAVIDRFAALGAATAPPAAQPAWTQEEILFQLHAADVAVRRASAELDEAVDWRAQLMRTALAAGLSPAEALRTAGRALAN